jgi:hypothetical protein
MEQAHQGTGGGCQVVHGVAQHGRPFVAEIHPVRLQIPIPEANVGALHRQRQALLAFFELPAGFFLQALVGLGELGRADVQAAFTQGQIALHLGIGVVDLLQQVRQRAQHLVGRQRRPHSVGAIGGARRAADSPGRQCALHVLWAVQAPGALQLALQQFAGYKAHMGVPSCALKRRPGARAAG